ncbi:hypothetical protein A6X21_12360 [Planctopirus hydrillae]|uniref:Uncharacterized protein n=1 Tax=Planctopirus hydrillae TaxID=1841610 RepID=A0A1C3E5J4_9PLAN|nr:hypothetical protein A6X21_12360 [Planctopirus hydrillae]
MAVRVRLPEAGFRRGTRGKLAEGVAGLGVSTVRVVMGGAFGKGVQEGMKETRLRLGMGLVRGGWGREL